MKHITSWKGFTLIEIVIFIIVSGVLISGILIAGSTGLLGGANTQTQITANFLAQQCLELMLGYRRLNGYAALACPLNLSGNCPTLTGFTVTPTVSCTTLGADPNFKTYTVVISGNASVTLRTLVANY